MATIEQLRRTAQILQHKGTPEAIQLARDIRMRIAERTGEQQYKGIGSNFGKHPAGGECGGGTRRGNSGKNFDPSGIGL